MKFKRHIADSAGFTLAEMILVVAVMAILVSLSTPPILGFMRQRDIQQEQNRLNEIGKAMRLYLADNSILPADSSTTWANDFARYTNLSAAEIANDTWGMPRKYIMYATTDTFLGTDINVYYATLHSSGPDRVADGSASTAGGPVVANSGIAQVNGSFAVTTNLWWWKNRTTNAARLTSFVDTQPALDDMMIRFTDYPDKIAKYKTSLERLERIAQALEGYSTTKYNEMVVFCMTSTCSPTAEKFIYYPRAASSGANTIYGSNTEADLTTYNSGNPINNSTTHATRRTHMINLMRILGLPDEYCCNALEMIAGTKNEMPFYYFSNPRPRGPSGACGTQPNPQSATPATARTLPARITVENTAATCG